MQAIAAANWRDENMGLSRHILMINLFPFLRSYANKLFYKYIDSLQPIADKFPHINRKKKTF